MSSGYTPAFRVAKGGLDLSDQLQDRVLSIKVLHAGGDGASDTCEITLDDRDFRIETILPGDALDVWLGYREVGLAFCGAFEVDEVCYRGMPKEIRVKGNRMGTASIMKAPRLKTYSSVSVAEIIEDLASIAGVKAFVRPKYAGIIVDRLDLVESPRHLLHELERTYGGVAKFSSGKLIFIPRGQGQDAKGTQLPRIVWQAFHFKDWEATHNNRTSFGSARASYYDENGVRRWLSASPPGTNYFGGGAKNLPSYDIGRLFPSKQQAEAGAKAQMEAMVRATGDLRATLATGDPFIKDQQQLLVRGMRGGIDGSYVIEEVVHRFTKSEGIRTTIRATPDPTGEGYEHLFDAADHNFLLPGPGEIVGSLIHGPGTRLAGPV